MKKVKTADYVHEEERAAHVRFGRGKMSVEQFVAILEKKKLHDVEERCQDISIASIRFQLGKLPPAEFMAFLKKIELELLTSHWNRRDMIVGMRDRLARGDLNEEETKIISAWKKRIEEANERINTQYNEARNKYNEIIAHKYNETIALRRSIEKIGDQIDDWRADWRAQDEEKELNKSKSNDVSRTGDVDPEYALRIPEAGLPNGGKMEGLSRSDYQTFLFQQVENAKNMYFPGARGRILDIYGWMHDQSKCEYYKWIDNYEKTFNDRLPPKTFSSYFRKWKRNKKSKSQDKMGTSAAKTQKTSGVKQRSRSLADDPNAQQPPDADISPDCGDARDDARE